MNGFSSSSSSWGVGKLSSDGNGVALPTGSSEGGGGVTLMMSILSCCPVTTVTSLRPNWGISVIEARRVILIASWSLSYNLCSRSRALSSLAAISAPVSPLALALPWAFLGTHFCFSMGKGLVIGTPRPSYAVCVRLRILLLF
jgi:hypothetical protein